MIRVRSGGAMVEIGPKLDAWLANVLDAATGTLSTELRQGMEDFRGQVRSTWYTQVDRETGQSGTFETVVELGERTISVGLMSTDERKAKGKPVVYYVHRPGPTSLIRGRGKPRLNPLASDGKYLIPELVTKPGRKLARDLAQRLGPQIMAAARRR